jgi:hypothetical protein
VLHTRDLDHRSGMGLLHLPFRDTMGREQPARPAVQVLAPVIRQPVFDLEVPELAGRAGDTAEDRTEE